MKRLLPSIETKFAIASLVFFTRVLDFESLSKVSEGQLQNGGGNPLAPILSLIQHSIFLTVISLLWLRRQDTIRTFKQGKVIWILVALVLASFLWSSIPNITLRGSFAFMETCAFGLYFASRYQLPEQLRLVAWALGITSLISLLYTIALPSYGIEDGIHAGAWRGPFIQKNIFARIVTLGCLTSLSVARKKLWHKCLVFSGLALSFGLIILSSSKTALIIFILLLFLSLIYQSFRLKDLVAIPLLLTLFISASAMTITVLANIQTILNFIGKGLTLSGRTTLWSGLVDQIGLNPWFGYGYMGFWRDFEAQSTITKIYGTTYVPPHSHNGYLELVISFGFVGALLFTITFIAIARRALILVRWHKTSEGLWPILFLSFIFLYNFTESTLIEHNSIFWIIYLSLAISRFIDLEQKPQLLTSNY